VFSPSDLISATGDPGASGRATNPSVIGFERSTGSSILWKRRCFLVRGLGPPWSKGCRSFAIEK
jgi:hypothetical protein